jgi:hypothetical protein
MCIRAWPCALLLLLALIATALARHEQLIPIYDHEFVTLHLGNPGTSVVFWLRWDADYISVRPSVDLQKVSRSFDPLRSSDTLCLGATVCPRVRLNIGYGSHEDPSEYADVHLPISARNYQGILGLGKRSPVWRHFRYYAYTFSYLALSAKPFGAIGSQQSQGDSLCVAGNFIPAIINGSNVWAQIRLDVDYSFVPYALVEATRTESWRLTLAGSKRTIKIDSALIHEHAFDGTVVSTLRPMTTRIMPNRTALAGKFSASVADVWHADDIIVLGRYFLGAGFVVSGDVLTTQVALSNQWLDRPWLVPSDYVWFYLPFGFFFIIWVFIMMQGTHTARSAQLAFEGLQPPALNLTTARTARLVVLDESGLEAREIPVPRDLRLGRNDDDVPMTLRQLYSGGDSEMSTKSPYYTMWLVLATRLVAGLFSVCVVFGFGFMDQFWRHGFGPYDQAAFGSALIVVLLYGAGIGITSSFPAVGVIWAQCMMLLLIWLAGAFSRFSTEATIAMVLSSGAATAFSTKQFFDMVMGDTPPARLYARPLWRRLAWIVISVLQMAWWIWICLFYTVPSICDYYNYVGDRGKWVVGASLVFPIMYWVRKRRSAQFANDVAVHFSVLARLGRIRAWLDSQMPASA